MPTSWLKYEEGQFFCMWPTKYNQKEIRRAIKRGGKPDPSICKDLIVEKIYPQKLEGGMI